MKNLEITDNFWYVTFPMWFRGVKSEKSQNIKNFEKLFLRRTLDPFELSNRLNFLKTVNIHILKVRKFGGNSAKATIYYRLCYIGWKSRWAEPPPPSISMRVKWSLTHIYSVYLVNIWTYLPHILAAIYIVLFKIHLIVIFQIWDKLLVTNMASS